MTISDENVIYESQSFTVERSPHPFVSREEGGHIRIFPKNHEVSCINDLTPQEAIDEAQIVEWCKQSKSEGKIVSPSNIGARTIIDNVTGLVVPWMESEYNPFWASVIRGLPPEAVAEFWYKIRHSNKVNWNIYNDKTLPDERRQPEYDAFFKLVVSALPSIGDPVKALYICMDGGGSLGSQFEYRIAQEYQVPIKKYKLNTHSSRTTAFLENFTHGNLLKSLLHIPDYFKENTVEHSSDDLFLLTS